MSEFESYSSFSSDWSNSTHSRSSSISSNDTSVFNDDIKDAEKRIPSAKLRFTAQQLALVSASQRFPTFVTASQSKCVKLHWACHVGWCLCRYQYQPLTPLHLLPNTPITDRSVGLTACIRPAVPSIETTNLPSPVINKQERLRLRLLTEGASYHNSKLNIDEKSKLRQRK